MRRFETLSKLHGGVTTYGVANNGDWLGVAALVADRLVGHRGSPSLVVNDSTQQQKQALNCWLHGADR